MKRDIPLSSPLSMIGVCRPDGQLPHQGDDLLPVHALFAQGRLDGVHQGHWQYHLRVDGIGQRLVVGRVQVEVLGLDVLEVVEPPRLAGRLPNQDERDAVHARQLFLAPADDTKVGSVHVLGDVHLAVDHLVEGGDLARLRSREGVGVVVDLAPRDEPFDPPGCVDLPVGNVNRVPLDEAQRRLVFQGQLHAVTVRADVERGTVHLDPAPAAVGDGPADVLHEVVDALPVARAVVREALVDPVPRGRLLEDVLVDLLGDAPAVVHQARAFLPADDSALRVSKPGNVGLVRRPPESGVDVGASAVDGEFVPAQLLLTDLDDGVLSGCEDAHGVRSPSHGRAVNPPLAAGPR